MRLPSSRGAPSAKTLDVGPATYIQAHGRAEHPHMVRHAPCRPASTGAGEPAAGQGNIGEVRDQQPSRRLRPEPVPDQVREPLSGRVPARGPGRPRTPDVAAPRVGPHDPLHRAPGGADALPAQPAPRIDRPWSDSGACLPPRPGSKIPASSLVITASWTARRDGGPPPRAWPRTSAAPSAEHRPSSHPEERQQAYRSARSASHC